MASLMTMWPMSSQWASHSGVPCTRDATACIWQPRRAVQKASRLSWACPPFPKSVWPEIDLSEVFCSYCITPLAPISRFHTSGLQQLPDELTADRVGPTLTIVCWFFSQQLRAEPKKEEVSRTKGPLKNHLPHATSFLRNSFSPLLQPLSDFLPSSIFFLLPASHTFR